MNGTAPAMNIQAFRVGRQMVIDPHGPGSSPRSSPLQPQQAPALPVEHEDRIAAVATSDCLKRLLHIRYPDLIEYQDAAYAERYLEFVDKVARREKELGLGSALAESVARYLYKLMAYKDEYEVARLSLDPSFDAAVRERGRRQGQPQVPAASARPSGHGPQEEAGTRRLVPARVRSAALGAAASGYVAGSVRARLASGNWSGS